MFSGPQHTINRSKHTLVHHAVACMQLEVGSRTHVHSLHITKRAGSWNRTTNHTRSHFCLHHVAPFPWPCWQSGCGDWRSAGYRRSGGAGSCCSRHEGCNSRSGVTERACGRSECVPLPNGVHAAQTLERADSDVFAVHPYHCKGCVGSAKMAQTCRRGFVSVVVIMTRVPRAFSCLLRTINSCAHKRALDSDTIHPPLAPAVTSFSLHSLHTSWQVAADIAAAGGEAFFISTDCSNADAINKAVAETVGKWGALHVAVGCVGGGPNARGSVLEQNLEHYHHCLAVTQHSAFYLVRQSTRTRFARRQ